jgi:phage-related protein
MSCDSLDQFKNILGDKFKQLSNSLKCIDNTSQAIAEQQSTSTDSLMAAIGPLTALEATTPGLELGGLTGQISGIGSSIGGFATDAVAHSGSLTTHLKSGIIGSYACTALDVPASDDDGATDPYADMVTQTSSVCRSLSDGFKSVRDAISGALSKIKGLMQGIGSLIGQGIDAITGLVSKVAGFIGECVSAVSSAISSAISAMVSTIADLASKAAGFIKNAFCAGMSAAMGTLGGIESDAAPEAPVDMISDDGGYNEPDTAYA